MPLQKLSEAEGKIHKAYGSGSGGKGFKFPNFPRLPTGILTLDIALAGGIPMGAVSLLYGNESSGKTSLALRIAAQFQKRMPGRKVCWIDVENAWDEDWVKLHGVDPDEVYLFKPTTAEQAADMAKEVGMSEDAGLVIVDSIAALASIDQLEKSAEAVVVGGYAKQATAMLRNLGSAASEHAKAGQYLTTIYINQPRTKIGVVFGNPEILPGPKLQHFQAFLKLRLSGKAVLKEKIAPISIYDDVTARIVKKKFPCIRQTAEWQMVTYPYNHKGNTLKPLTVNNRTHLERILDEHEFLKKEGKEWVLWPDGEVFSTKTAALDMALSDYPELVRWLSDELLMLYKDDIVANLEEGKSLDGLPTYST